MPQPASRRKSFGLLRTRGLVAAMTGVILGVAVTSCSDSSLAEVTVTETVQTPGANAPATNLNPPVLVDPLTTAPNTVPPGSAGTPATDVSDSSPTATSSDSVPTDSVPTDSVPTDSVPTDSVGSPSGTEVTDTDESTESEPSGSTESTKTSGESTDPTYDFDPLSLPDVEPADPDAKGPEGGTKCATNAAYFDEKPTGLEENLIKAWRAVEKAANADGVIVCLNDGKRSRAQQQATYDEYVETYGEEIAKQYVLPPEKSAHVTGNAIDIQPAAAFNWLAKTDGAFGLCRIYDNEAWHFEFQKSYAADGCPKLLPNPLG